MTGRAGTVLRPLWLLLHAASGQAAVSIHRDACGFDLRVEPVDVGPQRQAASDASFARSVEDRLRTNDAFTALAARLRNG